MTKNKRIILQTYGSISYLLALEIAKESYKHAACICKFTDRDGKAIISDTEETKTSIKIKVWYEEDKEIGI